MLTKDKIQEILTDEFLPEYIFVGDDSYLHAGHAEAMRSGGKHFSAVIVSKKFEGKKLVERHRMVYELLRPQMKKQIHALAIKALTPQEYKART